MGVKRGYVFSDSHMFSFRSTFDEGSCAELLSKNSPDFLVLNGDIFDFRWSRYRSIERSISEALEWLLALIGRYPRCHFYYLLGNHDSLSAFTGRLRDLALRERNFSLYPFYLRLGNSLFLHGDVTQVGGDPALLEDYRGAFDIEKGRGISMELLYRVVVSLRLQTVVPFLISREKLAESLVRYFKAVAPSDLAEVDNIYFGHVHKRFDHYRYGRWSFFNTGASIKGLRSDFIELRLSYRGPTGGA